VILTLRAPSGCSISLDFSKELGESVELCSFQFVEPPVEFRLTRRGMPLQEWQAGSTEIYDLQHSPGVKQWGRDGHWFTNDLNHRHDAMTCGVLCQGLVLQTRGLGLTFVLLVWPREGTWRSLRPVVTQLVS
jgi:hypothetical protein